MLASDNDDYDDNDVICNSKSFLLSGLSPPSPYPSPARAAAWTNRSGSSSTVSTTRTTPASPRRRWMNSCFRTTSSTTSGSASSRPASPRAWRRSGTCSAPTRTRTKRNMPSPPGSTKSLINSIENHPPSQAPGTSSATDAASKRRNSQTCIDTRVLPRILQRVRIRKST